MRSAAVDLNWMQLNLIDVYLTIVAFLTLPVILTCCLIKKLFCTKKDTNTKVSKGKKKKNL
jgi:hypothetical protein